jgi:hypothetical protein
MPDGCGVENQPCTGWWATVQWCNNSAKVRTPTLRTLSNAVNVGCTQGLIELRFVWPLLA